MEAFGGAREVQVFRDSHKTLQMTHLHVLFLPGMTGR
jgi:hypothetical protein